MEIRNQPCIRIIDCTQIYDQEYDGIWILDIKNRHDLYFGRDSRSILMNFLNLLDGEVLYIDPGYNLYKKRVSYINSCLCICVEYTESHRISDTWSMKEEDLIDVIMHAYDRITNRCIQKL